MRGAHEGKMEGMDMGDMKGMGKEGMKGMEGMQGMKGMESMPGMQMGDMKGMQGMGDTKEIVVAEARQVAGLALMLNTVPEKPKAGNVLLKLTLTDQAGKPVTNAQVVFVYTMPMPGMTDSKVQPRHTKEGLYEGTVLLGMGGTWVVTVNVTVPGRPPIAEKYQFSVAGGGM
jgi:hypothetical protein